MRIGASATTPAMETVRAPVSSVPVSSGSRLQPMGRDPHASSHPFPLRSHEKAGNTSRTSSPGGCRRPDSQRIQPLTLAIGWSASAITAVFPVAMS